MAEKEESSNEPVYIGIGNPVEVRRALLESSKGLIKILQLNESAKQRKKQKQQYAEELHAVVKEAAQLLTRLKSQMPKVKISRLPKKNEATFEKAQGEEKPKREPAIKQKQPKQKHLTETQKLEKELKDIEEKLRRL